MEARHKVVALRSEMILEPDTAHAVGEGLPPLHVRRKEQHQKRRAGPQRRPTGQHQPTRRKKDEQRDRQQASPQVVRHFPACHCRQHIPHARAALCGDRSPQPRQELPVAANPSVLARNPREIVTGKIVDDFNVGTQRHAGKQAFEQIVAQQRVVRHAAVERALERVDVVDALPNVAAFSKEVLIHVRHGRRIRVEADVP